MSMAISVLASGFLPDRLPGSLSPIGGGARCGGERLRSKALQFFFEVQIRASASDVGFTSMLESGGLPA